MDLYEPIGVREAEQPAPTGCVHQVGDSSEGEERAVQGGKG